MKDEEVWKDIKDYEGKYQVSNIGNIRSLEYHNAKGIKRIGLLRQAKDKKGYLRCALSKCSRLSTFKVHRLVATAFIPNPNNLPQINHIDGDKSNNKVNNLEWCDNSYNQKHAYSTGLNPTHAAHRTSVVLTHIHTGEILYFDQINKATAFLGRGRSHFLYLIKKGINICNNYKFDIRC